MEALRKSDSAHPEIVRLGSAPQGRGCDGRSDAGGVKRRRRLAGIRRPGILTNVFGNPIGPGAFWALEPFPSLLAPEKIDRPARQKTKKSLSIAAPETPLGLQTAGATK